MISRILFNDSSIAELFPLSHPWWKSSAAFASSSLDILEDIISIKSILIEIFFSQLSESKERINWYWLDSVEIRTWYPKINSKRKCRVWFYIGELVGKKNDFGEYHICRFFFVCILSNDMGNCQPISGINHSLKRTNFKEEKQSCVNIIFSFMEVLFPIVIDIRVLSTTKNVFFFLFYSYGYYSTLSRSIFLSYGFVHCHSSKTFFF